VDRLGGASAPLQGDSAQKEDGGLKVVATNLEDEKEIAGIALRGI
jgi:hypothetical protein